MYSIDTRISLEEWLAEHILVMYPGYAGGEDGLSTTTWKYLVLMYRRIRNAEEA